MNVKIIPDIKGEVRTSQAAVQGTVNNPTPGNSKYYYIGEDTNTAEVRINQGRRTISVNVLRTPNPLVIVDEESLVRYDGAEAATYRIKQYRLKQVEPADSNNAAEYLLTRDNVELPQRICIPKDRSLESVELKYCTTQNRPVSGLKKGDPYLEFTVENAGYIYLPLTDFIEVVSPGYALTSEKTLVNGKSRVILNVDYNKIKNDLNADYFNKAQIEAFVNDLNSQIDHIELEHEALSTRVDEEIARVEGLIESEQTRAQGEEQRIEAKAEELVASEKERAEAVEEDLDYLLHQEIDNRIADVHTEQVRAIAKEGELEAALDEEIQRARNAESSLQGKITTEKNRAQGEENRIETKFDQAIAAEQTRAEGRESSLEAKINKEIQDRIDDVDTEEARASATEQVLARQISEEVATRESDVATLTSRIESEERTRAAGDIVHRKDIDAIRELISPSTTAENPLVNKEFVNSSIQTATATFRGSFATKADLDAYSGEVDKNDYAIVRADETHDGESWRYKYVEDSNSWEAEYKLNDTAFTEAQLKALNSGVTDTKVQSYDSHLLNNSNPHGVTKSQIGLGNVDNTADINKPVSNPQREAINAVAEDLADHVQDTNNPHGVTKAQVGLGNVDNTSDLDKPISTATQTALSGKQATLVSGTNIKTVANKSVLGGGNLELTKSDVGLGSVVNKGLDSEPEENSENYVTSGGVYSYVNEAVEAKGNSNSRVYESIELMVRDMNTLAKNKMNAGDNVYITADSIPALWIVSVEDTSVPYTYTTDRDFLRLLTSNKNTTVQVGYFKFFKLTAGGAGSNITYIEEAGSGDLTLNILNDQVIVCTSKQITSLTLVLPSVEFPFNSEIVFSGNQNWAASNDFVITNQTGKELTFTQFGRTLQNYKPSTHSSKDAAIDLLFSYDTVKNIVCYVNEIPD